MKKRGKGTIGTVAYHHESGDYFEKRELRRYAGPWSLWALGVGAAISGNFFGWNFGLDVGGFGGLAIATLIIAIMYIGLSFSIAEMSPALPHAGGAYSFARSAMGPWGGFITGLAESMKYVLRPAAIAVGLGGYMGAVFNDLFDLDIVAPVWWLISYALFVGLNTVGVELAFKFSLFFTLLALAVLALFWLTAIPHFSWDNALNIAPTRGNTAFLPNGWSGIAAALPFAVWFYFAVEQLPLAAEESRDPQRDIPKGLLWGILTLVTAAVLTLTLAAGIAPGAAVIGVSDEPLFLAFRTISSATAGAPLLALVAVIGLSASLHAVIYAYGRNIYSLSRAGYFPHWLSVTHSERKTPHVALIAGAMLGFIIALLIELDKTLFRDVPAGAVLLSMAVFGAIISYIMQMISFVLLREKLPRIKRPYTSPLGNFGAIVAIVIAFVTLVSLLLDPDYRIGVYGCAIWFAAGLLYFALYGRGTLVYSPEEKFALHHLGDRGA